MVIVYFEKAHIGKKVIFNENVPEKKASFPATLPVLADLLAPKAWFYAPPHPRRVTSI